MSEGITNSLVLLKRCIHNFFGEVQFTSDYDRNFSIIQLMLLTNCRIACLENLLILLDI